MRFFPGHKKIGVVIALLILFSLMLTVSAAASTGSLTVVVKDARTRVVLGDALVYLDGAYKGTTGASGNLVMQDVRPGTHTVRVTRSGSKEVTKKISFPDTQPVDVEISRGSLVLVNADKASAGAINVVFYPSSTSYSCTDKAKVSNPLYLTNETRFREDVMKVIRSTYLELDKVTSPEDPLPADIANRFNFYYYYDPSSPADAFEGCAGTVPESYWKEVTFADVTVILYPHYQGIYSNYACQPTGCSQSFGPGRNLMKAPADQLTLIQHETGHAIFELVDTYCGNTYYYENNPYPNVWASLESCQSSARANQRDPSLCRQIQKPATASSSSCIQNYWQWDPMPDIMANGYQGKFGEASTQRINYVITQAGE